MKILNKKLKKKGSLLLIVSIGIIAIAGVVPFLISDTETSMLVSKSFDETNKQTWALESAVEDKLKESLKNIPELKTQTTNESAEEETLFKYENKATDTDTALPIFESKIAVKEYNTYLNKNSYYQANIKTQEDYNLNQLSAVEVKPGVTIVNNTTYVWDKYGKLYEINNQKKLIPIQIIDNNSKNQAVWQVVSDGLKPIAVIASKSLSVIKIDNDNNNNTFLGNGYYKFAAKSETFQAGIKQADKANLAIPTKTSIADSFNNAHPNARVEDISVSGNHGLAIVYDKDSAGKDTWQIWGWGDNSKGQINCLNEAPDSYNDALVNVSENYKEITLLTGSPSVDLSEFLEDEENNGIDAISDFFNDYYKYITENGKCFIIDPVTGEKVEHILDQHNNVGCSCPFCQDIADTQQGTPGFASTITITEPQPIKNLEILVDGSNSHFANKYEEDKTKVQCIITDLDNNEICKFSNGKVDSQNIYEGYGQNTIWAVKWSEEDLKKPGTNEFYTIPAGEYRCKFKASYNGHDNYNNDLKEEDLFWSWVDKSSQNNGNINSSSVYGSIFRINNNLYNFKDKRTERSSKVNYYAVTTGYNFSLALVSSQNWSSESGKPEYSIIGWGDATNGQLGNGIGSEKEKMTHIASITEDIAKDYKDMQAGTNHALFLTKSGDVYSWGGNADDISIYKVHKILFQNSPKIVYISAGYNKSAAIDEEGKIYEWSIIEGKEGTVVKPISDTSSKLFSCK